MPLPPAPSAGVDGAAPPPPSTTATTTTSVADIEALHTAAVNDGRRTYVDPASGYTVFTAAALRARGRCCGSGCRHCPYPAAPGTPAAATAAAAEGAAGNAPGGDVLAPTLHGAPLPPPGTGVEVVFFSGGKDSFLAAIATVAAADAAAAVDAAVPGVAADAPRVVLLTTHDARTGVVAHQEVPIATVARQATALRLPLVAVPLPSGGGASAAAAVATARAPSYGDRIRGVLRWLAAPPRGLTPTGLVFGDLHLVTIRGWREAEFGRPAAPPLRFPLWRVPYDELRRRLAAAGHPVRLCAVDGAVAAAAGVAVGDPYDDDLRARLPPGVDAWGENGEFHTVVACWEGGEGGAAG